MRVVAVAVLVLGIVVMHHVDRSGHGGSGDQEASTITAVPVQVVGHEMGANAAGGLAAAEAEDEAPSAGHDLLHLCLTVMTAAAVLVVGWLLLARRGWMSTTLVVAFRARPVPARPPPRPHGSALLRSLCVMRT